MYQLRVVAFGVQKVIFLPFAVRAPTWLDDRFWKFLIELIDMKVHFWNFKSLVLVVQFGPKLSFFLTGTPLCLTMKKYSLCTSSGW